MPSLFVVSGYRIFFWANENNEPIHIHVCKGEPRKNATKIWLTKTGGCILAQNKSEISKKELRKLMEFISAQFFLICEEWKKFFLLDEIDFILILVRIKKNRGTHGDSLLKLWTIVHSNRKPPPLQVGEDVTC